MSLGRNHRRRTERLNSWGSGKIYRAYTEWELGIGIDLLGVAILVAAMEVASNGATLVELAVQTAEVRVDDPDDWQVVSSGVSVTGESSARRVG